MGFYRSGDLQITTGILSKRRCKNEKKYHVSMIGGGRNLRRARESDGVVDRKDSRELVPLRLLEALDAGSGAGRMILARDKKHGVQHTSREPDP
jgi:hypothetical protein